MFLSLGPGPCSSSSPRSCTARSRWASSKGTPMRQPSSLPVPAWSPQPSRLVDLRLARGLAGSSARGPPGRVAGRQVPEGIHELLDFALTPLAICRLPCPAWRCGQLGNGRSLTSLASQAAGQWGGDGWPVGWPVGRSRAAEQQVAGPAPGAGSASEAACCVELIAVLMDECQWDVVVELGPLLETRTKTV